MKRNYSKILDIGKYVINIDNFENQFPYLLFNKREWKCPKQEKYLNLFNLNFKTETDKYFADFISSYFCRTKINKILFGIVGIFIL